MCEHARPDSRPGANAVTTPSVAGVAITTDLGFSVGEMIVQLVADLPPDQVSTADGIWAVIWALASADAVWGGVASLDPMGTSGSS